MKLNKDSIRILMKGLLVNTFSVIEFKDPDLRLPKYPMSFTVLSESLEVGRTDDGLPMTDFLKISKVLEPEGDAGHSNSTETDKEQSSVESEVLDLQGGDVGYSKKRKLGDKESSRDLERQVSDLQDGDVGYSKKRKLGDEESSRDLERQVLTDFLNGDDADVMIDNFNKFMEKSNTDQLKQVIKNAKNEKDLATGFGIHLISKLAGNVSIKRGLREGNKCPCGCDNKLEGNPDMWIGSEEIWHGELDLIAGSKARGDDLVAFTFQKDDGTEEIDTDEETLTLKESPGERVNVEIKSLPTAGNMSQVIALSVVFAFTEWNRHKEKGRLIPSVLLTPTFFQVLIYNPVDDFLFQSNKFYFSFEEHDFRPFFILWIVLNHRKFFVEKLPESLKIACSGFKRTMNNSPEKISIFKKMDSYKSQIAVRKSTETGHAVYSHEMIYRDCYVEAQKRFTSESD